MSAKDKTYTPSEAIEGMLEITPMVSADGTDLVPCLLGGVGIGKSSLVEQYAKTLANGRKLVYGKINPSEDEFSLIDLRIADLEPEDTRGVPVVDMVEGEPVQRLAQLQNLPISGSGDLFLDEFAQATPEMQKIAGRGVRERIIGETKISDGFKIVLAGNRQTDRAGANSILSHLLDRVIEMHVEGDTNSWLAWATKNDVHPLITSFINYQPQFLNHFDPKLKESQSSSRTWSMASPIVQRFENDLTNSMFGKLMSGCIGSESTAEFLTFVNLMQNVPSLDDIVSGEDVEVPEGVGLQYATCCGLVKVLSECKDKDLVSYWENALKYVEKFPTAEFGIYFVRSCVGARPELEKSKAFGQFRVDNQNLIL